LRLATSILVLLVLFFPCLASGQEHALPCYADVLKSSMPHDFQGIGKWKAGDDEVQVTIHFITTAVTNTPCVGEPLVITVPNGQKVSLDVAVDPGFDQCVNNATITAAPSQFPIAELMGLIPKTGIAALIAPPISPTPYHLKPLQNKIETITATCEAGQSKYIQPVSITYQNPPRVSVSAGFVAAPGVESFGIKTAQTGVGAGGVVTTQNSLAITGSPAAQFIPFSFVNLYFAGSRTLNLNLQLGLGVNPNLSTPKVEFFAAPVALSWHDVYFSPGFHIGQHEQLTGGFRLGELTPSSLSKPPLGWQYYTGFGFSLSYNLKPLVKSSGK
jgi:hypothetical protein